MSTFSFRFLGRIVLTGFALVILSISVSRLSLAGETATPLASTCGCSGSKAFTIPGSLLPNRAPFYLSVGESATAVASFAESLPICAQSAAKNLFLTYVQSGGKMKTVGGGLQVPADHDCDFCCCKFCFDDYQTGAELWIVIDCATGAVIGYVPGGTFYPGSCQCGIHVVYNGGPLISSGRGGPGGGGGGGAGDPSDEECSTEETASNCGIVCGGTCADDFVEVTSTGTACNCTGCAAGQCSACSDTAQAMASEIEGYNNIKFCCALCVDA